MHSQQMNILSQTVSLTNEGREFMIYARQILDQVKLMEAKYKQHTVRKQAFSVSAQHYAFVVHAFVDLIKQVDAEEYQFTLRKTETQNILEDVMSFKSSLGIPGHHSVPVSVT